MKNIILIMSILSLTVFSCQREEIELKGEKTQQSSRSYKTYNEQDDFFYSLNPSDPDNPQNVILCVTGTTRMCRNDLSLSEACD